MTLTEDERQEMLKQAHLRHRLDLVERRLLRLEEKLA